MKNRRWASYEGDLLEKRRSLLALADVDIVGLEGAKLGAIRAEAAAFEPSLISAATNIC